MSFETSQQPGVLKTQRRDTRSGAPINPGMGNLNTLAPMRSPQPAAPRRVFDYDGYARGVQQSPASRPASVAPAPAAPAPSASALSPTVRPGSISFGRRDGSTARYAATEEQAVNQPSPIITPPPAANASILTPTPPSPARQLAFSARGDSVPRGQDALHPEAGLYAKRFGTPGVNVASYGDYVKRLFDGAQNGPASLGQFQNSPDLEEDDEVPTIDFDSAPDATPPRGIKGPSPSRERSMLGVAPEATPTINHPGDAPKSVVRATPPRGKISRRGSTPEAPAKPNLGPGRTEYLAAPVPILPKYSSQDQVR